MTVVLNIALSAMSLTLVVALIVGLGIRGAGAGAPARRSILRPQGAVAPVPESLSVPEDIGLA